MKVNVLVVAAHPDDEVLGCGGAIARYSDQGASVYVAFLADGVLSRTSKEKTPVLCNELKMRREAAQQAGEILGVKSIFFGDFPDNRLDTVALLDVVKVIESLISEYKPEIIFTHHGGDLNIDHRRIHEAVVTACRPQHGYPVRTLLFFEVPSSTEWQMPGTGAIFAPNWFINISQQLDRKMAALNAYHEEMRAWPHSRSLRGVESLARWRGATTGTEAAEAFMLGRQLL